MTHHSASAGGDPLEWLTRTAGEVRAALEDGGPPLDFAAVVDYVDGRLGGEQKEVVCYLVSRYRAWHQAYEDVCRAPSPEAQAALERERREEAFSGLLSQPTSAVGSGSRTEGTLVMSLSAATGERRTLAEFGDDRMRVGVVKARGGALVLAITLGSGQLLELRLVRVMLAGHDDGSRVELVVGLGSDGHGEISLSRFDHTLELAAERPGARWQVTAALVPVDGLRADDRGVLEQSLRATEDPGCGVPIREALARLSTRP